MKKIYTALGMMSGTSGDGIDASLIKSDGETQYEVLKDKETPITKIKWLLTSTSSSWLKQAISNPIELLIDHANCERKAAGAAVQMMFRYLCEPGLADILSPLAREELEHFERICNGEIKEEMNVVNEFIEVCCRRVVGSALRAGMRMEQKRQQRFQRQ